MSFKPSACCYRAFVLLMLIMFSLASLEAQIRREPNTTLTLPLEPVSADGEIVLAEAFPGVTFDAPVCIRSLPGDTNRLFVIERKGRVMLMTNLAEPNPQIFLDIRDHVFASDWITDRRTEGLTSIAFHPRFQENGRFFVSYSFKTNNAEGETEFYNRLSEFQASEDRLTGLRESEIPYITQFDEGDGHNINDLHFGPDGYLYVAIGDEGDGNTGGDEYNNAEKIDKDFFSAIMRIDVDKRPGNLLPNPHPANTTNYFVPMDNPFVGATNFLGKALDTNQVRTEFWAVGLRNPWRISFDPLTGAMYEGDVGQHAREEINRIVKGGNYGWSFKEGTEKGPKAPAPEGYEFIDPIAQYSSGYGQSEGFSVTGGVVYRGFQIPALYGSLLFADYVSGNLWAINVDQTPTPKPVWLLNHTGIASFGYDPRDGNVLLVYHNETNVGKIFKLEVSGGTGETYPETLSDTGVFSNIETLTPNEGIVPYEVNLSFWSDGAIKSRWFSIPDPSKQMVFSPDQNWRFPDGTVWIKHFELETEQGVASSARRIETRVLVKCSTGSGIYGLSYKWDTNGVNATLVGAAGDEEVLTIHEGEITREQKWLFPGRAECLACHTVAGGLALGFNTAQLNKSVTYGEITTNQISALGAAGYIENPPWHLSGLRALARPDDEAVTRTARVRSYLAANCAFCHQPGGSALAAWDARTITPLSFANIINGSLNNSLGDLTNRVIVPGSLDHSALFRRISSSEQRMPPVGTTVLDQTAMALLGAWITNDLPSYEIYSSWAQRVFPEDASLDRTESADPDGDGLSNYEEYLAGTDPLAPGDVLPIEITPQNQKVQISVTQPPNRALILESSPSLSDPFWQAIDAPDNSVTFPAQARPRSVLDWLSGNHRFYRARLIEP